MRIYKEIFDSYTKKSLELKEKFKNPDEAKHKAFLEKVKKQMGQLPRHDENPISELLRQKKRLELQIQSTNRAIRTLGERHKAQCLTNIQLLHENEELEKENKHLGHINGQRAEISSKIKQSLLSEKNTTERQQLTISNQKAEIERLQGNKSVLEVMEARKKGLEVKIEGFETKIVSIEREIKKLRAANNNQKARISEQGREITRKSAYAEGLEKTMAQYKSDLETSRDKNHTLQQENKGLKQSKKKQEEKIKSHDTEIAAQKIQISEQDKRIDVQKDTVVNLTTEVNQHTQTIESQKKELAKSKRTNEKIHSEFSEIKKSYETKNAELNRTIKSLHGEVKERKATHEKISRLVKPNSPHKKRTRPLSLAPEGKGLTKQELAEQEKNKKDLFSIITTPQAEFIEKLCSLIKKNPEREQYQTQLYKFTQGKNNSSQLLMQNTVAPLDISSLTLKEKKIVFKAFYVFSKLAGKSDSFFPENEKKKIEYRKLYKKYRAEYRRITGNDDLNESTTSIISAV